MSCSRQQENCLHAALVQANPSRLLLAVALGLLVLSVANKSATLDDKLSSWIQRTSRIDSELNYVSASIGEGQGSSSQLLLQTPKHQRADVLSVDALMIHLEAMAIATHVTVDHYDVTWSLKDICFTPTLPDFDLPITTMLDRIIPCVIKTPLDCFWEGSKLLGPDPPISSMNLLNSKWTSLNPMFVVESVQRSHAHSSIPYATLIDWMRRVGLTTGYQLKPCLDPTDPNCPMTSPNKRSREPPDIGLVLTGGCRGFAANQMHWKEEEIVGGFVKNKSGHITKATGLQSSIQLMGEQDMFDYWRKTSKVQDVDNWSVEKAKLILESWQIRFKQELEDFTRTSQSSSSYKIHAMTSKSMLEPIDAHSLLDLTNLELSLSFMIIFTCLAFPTFIIPPPKKTTTTTKRTSFEDELKQESQQISRIKMSLPVAGLTGIFAALTFLASLGISSFMNLPFNMATTQILPPLALFYCFNQNLMIANIYSQKFTTIDWPDLTSECLREIYPAVVIESIAYIIALMVTTLIPVPAARIFASQAITFIVVSTLTGIIVMPALMTVFLKPYSPKPDIPPLHKVSTGNLNRAISRIGSPCKFSISARKSPKPTPREDPSLDEEIFSRLKDDLKNIQADRHNPADINFSAQLEANGIRTNFTLSTTQTSQVSDNSRSTAKLTKTHRHLTEVPHDLSILPDIVTESLPKIKQEKPIIDDELLKPPKELFEQEVVEKLNPLYEFYEKNIVEKKPLQVLICLLALILLLAMLLKAPDIRYGLQLKDIVARGSPEYESFLIQEKNFPVYNVYAVVKGNFDYPNNQKLLYDYHKTIAQVDGIVRDEDGSKPKFWLYAFKDWLLEIQDKFDIDRSKGLISVEGWAAEATDAAKLAYKLLAQTGRADNPIDKSLIETNRLVDSAGIINPKAFYYYLTGWVNEDAFTYATSEANFKPEPRIWSSKPDDLKIEKARPLTYAQIPFLMKLPTNLNSLDTISEIRSISQIYEQLNLPNFPTGVPFIFWDQFLNLDLLLLSAVAIGLASIFIVIGITLADFNLAAIITLPISLTLLCLYCCVSYLSIPFNNVLAILLISAIGIATVQTVHYATYFESIEGSLLSRTRKTIRYRFRTVITSLILSFICVLIFYQSKIEFMVKYSHLLFCLTIINTINSLLLTPIILSNFGSKYKPNIYTDFGGESQRTFKTPNSHEKNNKKASSSSLVKKPKFKLTSHKKRKYPRMQSEISLSTISEEPQSESHVQDLKIDLSIRCY